MTFEPAWAVRRAAPSVPALLLMALQALGPAWMNARAETPRPTAAAPPRAGARIYREGVLPSGGPLVAVVGEDVRLKGARASCAQCHRRSGLGSIEAGKLVLPITGPSLFQPSRPDRARLFRALYQEPQPGAEYARVRAPHVRPAYDDRSLAVAIRTGADPTGRTLGELMPRYELNDEDMSVLIDYLKELGASGPIGVDGETIHFATVVTPDVPAAEREAMMSVISAYAAEKDLEARRYRSRPGVSPHYKSDLLKGYRRWDVREWALSGPPERYREQLDRFQSERPVFALLCGISRGDWRPIHEFCEASELPCFFPQADLPADDAEGGHTLYLSRGLPGQAAVLAAFLKQDPKFRGGRRIVQAHRRDTPGARAAEAFERALKGAPFTVRNLVLTTAGELNGRLRAGPETSTADALVLWLDERDRKDAGLDETMRVLDRGELFMPSSFADEIGSGLDGLPAGASLVFPFELPERRVPHLYRARSWMSSRRIPAHHETIRLNTYFALSVTAHALGQLVDEYSRDYLIERAEHETENALNPGVYPRPGLGPDQRYASKGGYIVRITNRDRDRLEPRSEWLAP